VRGVAAPRAISATRRRPSPEALGSVARLPKRSRPQESRMPKSEGIVIEGTRRASDVPRARRCLRCGSSFESEWSGERICRRCKSTTSWRNGLPHNHKPEGRNR
jgi:hypothetical protein